MDYYYNQNNSDYPYDEPMQINQPKNMKIYQNEKNQYLNTINPKIEYPLDLSSSQEEINSKEDIIQSKLTNEIQSVATGRFRYMNTEGEQEKEKETINDTQQDNNEDDNNKSNKITNNICIIINKPELKDTKKDKKVNIDYLDTFGNGEKVQNEQKERRIKNKSNENFFKRKKLSKRKLNRHKKSKILRL